VFRTLERIDAVLYVQRFIRHPGYDLRVLVLDGRPLGAMRRYARDGFKTNISCQGRAEPCIPGDDDVIRALRADGVPGWRAFRQATQMDVAARLVEWLAEHRRNRESRPPQLSLVRA
jgi:ribosomal protein S6--L-glutamate ligase